MKLLIALIVTLIMLTVFKNVETLAASLSYPYDNSGFEDRPPQGVFNTIVTAHNQELVMSRLRVYEIVPVKPSTVFTTDVPEIFVVFQLHQHGAEFRKAGGEGLSGETEGREDCEHWADHDGDADGAGAWADDSGGDV